MRWQCRPSPRKRKHKEPTSTAERGNQFRVVHLPDRPLERVSHGAIPAEMDCGRIFLDWKSGKVRPPRVRSKRISRNLEGERRAENSASMDETRLRFKREEYTDHHSNQRRGRGNQEVSDMAPSLSSTGGMARRSIKYIRSQKPPQPPQQTLLPTKVHSHHHLPLRPPQPPSDQIYSPARHSSAYPQSPALSAFTCPLCRSSSADNDGGLCGTCKAEFAISSSGFGEEDEYDLHLPAWFPRTEQPTASALGDSTCSSSVYSSGENSLGNGGFSVSPELPAGSDDPMLAVSPCSSIDDSCTPVADMGIPASYLDQHERGGVETEETDLYELDWAEYYFNENNFRHTKDLKGGRRTINRYRHGI
ncbi:hypothetical protein V8C37DRAFT_42192 [Trichoderma ceciliae]